MAPNATRGAARASPEAAQWLKKALGAYDQEDYGGAKLALAMALQEEPNFSEAYLLKGMLEYHDGKLEDANASWQRALQLNPRLPEEMRQRLQARAHALEAGLTTQDFAHFRLEFNGAQERDQAWQAVKDLNEAYNDLGSRFGIFPPGKFPVIIFTSQEFWEVWVAPLWLGGFFDQVDGRIRVRFDELPGGEEEFRHRLRHEFTHAFIHQIYPKELPLWFNEGIAQFYAYSEATNTFWKDTRLDAIGKLIKGAPWLEMADVERVLRKKDVAPGFIYLSYLESEALALYVAKGRGDSWIPFVMERVRKGMTFADAFKDVVSFPPAEALERLHHSLQ